MRIGTTARGTMALGATGGVALLIGVLMLAPARAASPQTDGATAERPAATDLSAQNRRRRGPTRLRVTPNYSYPGPNAVRQCDAYYEQEYRQAGTVIVPRMRCRWVRG